MQVRKKKLETNFEDNQCWGVSQTSFFDAEGPAPQRITGARELRPGARNRRELPASPTEGVPSGVQNAESREMTRRRLWRGVQGTNTPAES